VGKHIDMRTKVDITGKIFNRLKVIDYSHTDKRSKSYWKCVCECGNEVIVRSDSLTSGNTKACGCLSKELKSKMAKTYLTKHGETKTRLYKIWSGMRDRCSSFGTEKGKHYADKGITICKEWDEFIPFKEWSLSNGYESNLTIDRINVNGNYEPSNCRWLTIQEQERNRGNSIYVVYNGERKHLKDWSKDLNINYHTLYQRYKINTNPEYVLRKLRGE
jgi:hypothetical protein